MNTYLLPMCDPDGPWIEKAHARNYDEAIDKFFNELSENYGIECEDWEGLTDKLTEIDVYVGNIYDIDEF